MMVSARAPHVSRAAFPLSLVFICLLFNACTSKTPPPVEKVTVAVPANLSGVFFHVAREKGFFREEGLDVALHVHPYGKVALDNMVSWGADFAVSAETPLVFTSLRADEFVRKDPSAALEIAARGTRADREILRQLWPLYEFGVKLDQSLLINMENQARWAIGNRPVPAKAVPDFLKYVHVDGLLGEKPAFFPTR